MVSRVGIEPTTRRLRDGTKSKPMKADPGKLGSALPRQGRPRPIVDACFRTFCKFLQEVAVTESRARRFDAYAVTAAKARLAFSGLAFASTVSSA